MLRNGVDDTMLKTSRSQRLVMLTLATIGLLVAAYLTWSHYNEGSALCAQGGGCDIVRSSRYSEVANIPVAAFGLLGYVIIAGVLLLESRVSLVAENATVGLFGLTLIGFIYSGYLTYLELFVIFAICPYCVASAVIMTLLFVLSIYRLVNNLQPDES